MQVTEVDIAQKIAGCARCGVAFKYRPSKKYCSANCRKRANEPKQNSFSSKKVRHENEHRLERAKWLGIEYYRTPPRFRFSFIFELKPFFFNALGNTVCKSLSNESHVDNMELKGTRAVK